MARKHNIRWSDKDSKELRRLTKNYNAKVRRLEKKFSDNPELIPERIRMRDIKKEVKTRDDLKFHIQNIKSVTKRGSEDIITTKEGVEITKYEVDIAKRSARKINRRRKQEKKELGIKDIPRGMMGSIEQNDLKPTNVNINKSKTRNDFRDYVDRLKNRALDGANQERINTYKNNYIQALNNALGSHADDIVKLLDNIDAEKILSSKYIDERYGVDFVYDPQDVLFLATMIKQAWEDIM